MHGRSSGSEPGNRSTLVSPAGSGGLRARLVRAPDDAASPFVAVHDGRYARILLAELVGDDGVALTRFAWKLRVDAVPPDPDSTRPAPNNSELDRIWQQERAELLRVHSPHVVAPVAVPAALTQSLPLFYCRRVDRYFHPVCPDTGARLSVCRDDAVLQAAGLPAYARDTVRYLHGSGSGDDSAKFYTAHDTSENGQAESGHLDSDQPTRVSGARQLVRSWSRVAHGEHPDSELPCQSCEHRNECYPAAGGDAAVPAEQHLHAVSFYDVDSLALELAAMDFDTAIMRLGGGLEHSSAGVASARSQGATSSLSGHAAAGSPSARAWMGGRGATERTLETLQLKLAAFADVCRGVRALHGSGRPHLGVSPANIVAFDGGGSSALPGNWRMRFALTDLGGAIPVQVPSTESAGDASANETLWQPGHEVIEDETSRLFLSPSLRSLEGGSVTMSVACREVVDPGVPGGTRQVIDVHRAGVPSFVLPGDLLCVEPVSGVSQASALGQAEASLAFARVDEVGARGLAATLLPGGPCGADWSGTTFDARLAFVRRSSPSADLYGLGMLLLRMLLVHDEQTLAEVSASAERCLQVMASASVRDDGVGLADRWHEILEGDDGEGRFASWHVMHHRSDRQVVFDSELQGRAVVPKQIWHALMALAGKLLLASPVTRGEDRGAAWSAMVGVLAEVESIQRQLHVELFEREARDAAIAVVCAQRAVALRGDLGAQAADELSETTSIGRLPGSGNGGDVGRGDVGNGEAQGFVLAVGRAGESSIQQYRFAQDRVTIGRRDVDNLLVLSDPMVSSKHAVIERCDDEFVLFDCGSTNGTEVDGIRLPVEVPHPLDDGSVIHIRPFMLSFRPAGSEVARTAILPRLSVGEVKSELRRTYAEFADRSEQEVHVALSSTLDSLRTSLGRAALLASLEAVLKEGGGAEPAAKQGEVAAANPGNRDDEEVELGAVALRAVRQLARSLADNIPLERGVQLQEFAGRMQRFVDVTSTWIGEMLEWRRVFGKRLELQATQPGAVRPPLRTAAEVRDELLVPGGDGSAVPDYFLSRFFDDVLAILEDLLRGNQRQRLAVRERLDPERLVAEASGEAKLGLLTKAAAGSALWKVYVAAFEELTAGGAQEEELERLLRHAAERRANGD